MDPKHFYYIASENCSFQLASDKFVSFIFPSTLKVSLILIDFVFPLSIFSQLYCFKNAWFEIIVIFDILTSEDIFTTARNLIFVYFRGEASLANGIPLHLAASWIYTKLPTPQYYKAIHIYYIKPVNCHSSIYQINVFFYRFLFKCLLS